MNPLLESIVASKKNTLERTLAFTRDNDPAAELGIERRDFKAAVSAGSGVRVIAEIKQASPSKGLLTTDFEPATIAREYERGGAVALSVLTDEPFFRGSPRYLLEAKRATGLPALCKDFMIDPRQMRWAAAFGADAVLLIVRILSPDQFSELLDAAATESLTALVEAHTESELEFALDRQVDLIGVNCRDLDTFTVDLNRTVELAARIPCDTVSIAESGISRRSDIERLRAVDYDAFLIGESLMTANDRVAALREMVGE